MFDQIFVAVDGTDTAQPALDHAVALARQSDAALTGIFVIDDQWADFIGNDWQSARNARQGFLDYMREEQEQRAQAAREQFEMATTQIPRAAFTVFAGDPTEVLLDQIRGDGRMLFLSRRVFQVSGRPSLKSLGKRLAEHGEGAVFLFP